MVFPGEKEEEDEEEDYTKKKRKTLHNFSFTDLKWGAQRSLRCSKIESNGGSPSPVAAVDQRLRRRSSPPKEDDYEEEKTNKKAREMEVSPSWNLRKRRGACKEAPVTGSGGNNQKDEKGVRPKFNSTLSKKEVEDDFMAMVGHGPPRRPKKRPRNVQKRINSLYPAFYFGEVTKDIYDVPDASENGKK